MSFCTSTLQVIVDRKLLPRVYGAALAVPVAEDSGDTAFIVEGTGSMHHG